VSDATRIAFGPVPSRRLGRSLGINNIPPKHCSYSCLYCQVGRTSKTETSRLSFRPPDSVVEAVERKVAECRAARVRVDFLTFVPDGEPTLDVHLGEEIRGLKGLGIPVAVISNGSLLWRPDVRAELAQADLVSVKVDAAEERTWRRINRPEGRLTLRAVLEGMEAFARGYRGELITETMVLRNLNDDPASVHRVAEFLVRLRPSRAYLSAPARPPAEAQARLPTESALLRAREILSSRVRHVELMVEEVEGDFDRTGDPVEDLLAILAVHPMREAAATDLLKRAGSGRDVLDDLVASGEVVRVRHGGHVVLTLRRANDPEAG
jgi:wyosine [tRNA(Phe)-imidazoG37] synthetase (radical SAM superfamily)